MFLKSKNLLEMIALFSLTIKNIVVNITIVLYIYNKYDSIN